MFNARNCGADEFPRGAIVKAMAICTRHSFLHIYKVGSQQSPIAEAQN